MWGGIIDLKSRSEASGRAAHNTLFERGQGVSCARLNRANAAARHTAETAGRTQHNIAFAV